MRSMRRISSMTSCQRLRLQGYMSALSVRAQAGGARSSLKLREEPMLLFGTPSEGGVSKRSIGSALKAKERWGEIRKRGKKKERTKMIRNGH